MITPWSVRSALVHNPTDHPLTCANTPTGPVRTTQPVHQQDHKPLTCGNASGPSGPPLRGVRARTRDARTPARAREAHPQQGATTR